MLREKTLKYSQVPLSPLVIPGTWWLVAARRGQSDKTSKCRGALERHPSKFH